MSNPSTSTPKLRRFSLAPEPSPGTDPVHLRIEDHRPDVALEVLVVPFENAVERAEYVQQTRRTIERRTDDNNSGRVVEAGEEGGTLTIHVYPLGEV